MPNNPLGNEDIFQRPTGWVVSGISLFLIGAGDIMYQSDTATISVGSSIGHLPRFVLSLLGVLLISVGVFVVSHKWTSYRRLILGSIAVFWFLSLVAVVKAHFWSSSASAYPFVDVDYRVPLQKLHISLSNEYLHEAGFNQYILAAIPTKVDREVFDTQSVVFSSVIDRPQNTLGDVDFDLNFKEIASQLTIGDTIMVYLICSKKFPEVKKGTCIADIDGGGDNILRRYETTYAIKSATPENVLALFSNLPPHDQTRAMQLLTDEK